MEFNIYCFVTDSRVYMVICGLCLELNL